MRDTHESPAWSWVEGPFCGWLRPGELSGAQLAEVREMVSGVNAKARAGNVPRLADLPDEGIGRALHEAGHRALPIATGGRPDGVVDEGTAC